MLKIIGGLLIIIGATGMGVTYRQEMKDRLYNTKCLHSILELLESEIGYSKASLPEACGMIASRMNVPYSTSLYKVREMMKLNAGLTFSFVWKQEMGRCLEKVLIGNREKEVFLNFPEAGSYADNMMQLKTLDKCKKELQHAVNKQEEKMESKSKVVMSMGLIGGLFLTIALL